MYEIIPKISVIVPVYKAEAYLHRCVHSLLAQTFSDFEILLIDDGSPDSSGVICDEYARKDKRVRVFHKENGGVSSARQCGMDHAVGEYTIHADPDDWVEPNMLEELYKEAKKEDADMVICDFYIEEKKKTKYIVQKPSTLDHETVLRELFQQLHGSCCNKLVRRTCYCEFGVSFPLLLSNLEDFYVNCSILSNDIRIAYLPQAFYHYVRDINSNSLSHRKIEKLIPQYDLFLQFMKEVLPQSVFTLCLVNIKFQEAGKVIVAGGERLLSFKKDYRMLNGKLHLVYCSLVKKFVVYLALRFSPNLVHFLYIIIYRKNNQILVE